KSLCLESLYLVLRAGVEHGHTLVFQSRAEPLVYTEVAGAADRADGDELDAGLPQREDPVEQQLVAAALVEIGDQHDRGAAWIVDLLGSLLQCEIDVRPAAELRSHQHLEPVRYRRR